jgi:phospholipase C
MRKIFYTISTLLIALALLLGLTWHTTTLDRIQHIIVIYQENWSFDGLYGNFPGADGLAQADDAYAQVDRDGKPYLHLPQPLDTRNKPPVPDTRFPADLTVAPFDLARFVPHAQRTGDLVYRFYQEKQQIDDGKMDKFIAWSDAGGLVMSYYDGRDLPEGRLAREFTLADNFFHAAFGGSFLNHFWLVCACTPVWQDAPAQQVAQIDTLGLLIRDGAVTPDGYAVNTAFSVNQPHPARITDPALFMPEQTMPTIGDRLSEKHISWAWYSGGWKDALAGKPDPLFQFHHQPFAYFAKYADNTEARAEHLKDEDEFFSDVAQHRLPSVVFIKPLGPDDEHPGYASLRRGQEHVLKLVNAVRNSPYFHRSLIITYDENGGRWDHVAPPIADRWGPGTRVPAIIISPYARRGFVDHTQYDTTSILRTIERRWQLEPLGPRDAAARDLSPALAD